MLDQKDENKIKKIVVEAIGGVLEDMVLPRFESLEDNVKSLKNDVASLNDRMGHVELSINRIEMRQIAEAERADQHGLILHNHEKRLSKLEAKKA